MLKAAINKILGAYPKAKEERFAENPFGIYMRQQIPQILYSEGKIDSEKYLITGSVGAGNWATIPWICIFDRSITTSARQGVYIVYLLAKDGETLYLTLNQGCSELKEKYGKKTAIKMMQDKAKAIRVMVGACKFIADDHIDLGDKPGVLGEMYQKGTIFHCKYERGKVPEETTLQNDLIEMMHLYKKYVALEKGEELPEDDKDDEREGGENEVTVSTKQAIDEITSYIMAKGFSYPSHLIENFYLSLKSKPFVLLAGTSGTGKTRLVKLFAESIGATESNGRYKMVSVRPDWSDSSDLFGHVNLSGKFVPGALTDFVLAASKDPEKPYFLCLDEMNLARVEYYLSDVLSVIETRDFVDDDPKKPIVTSPILKDSDFGKDEESRKKYSGLQLPENLYIVGTVNMDETTFPFSRKVLDRANTIEFSDVDLTAKFGGADETPEPLNLGNHFLRSEYLILQQCADEADDVTRWCDKLQEINEILRKADSHVGYRVRDEIVFYMLNNKHAELLTENEAMDFEIMQKILPRIKGSSRSVKEMLCELYKTCAGEYEGLQTKDNNVGEKMQKHLEGLTCKYPLSAAKIAFMVRRYEEDGFTSYWI